VLLRRLGARGADDEERDAVCRELCARNVMRRKGRGYMIRLRHELPPDVVEFIGTHDGVVPLPYFFATSA
jgi:hypothetical protein